MIGIIDLVILGMIIISVLFALYRGLVRELLGISSWILAGFTAIYSYDPLLKFGENRFENVKLSALIGSVVLALIVLVAMTIINAIITKKLRKSSLSGLDRIFGFFFGIARALLIVVLIYLFATTMMLSPKYVQELSTKNYSIHYIQLMAEKLQNLFPENIRTDLSEYQTAKEEKIKKIEENIQNKIEEQAQETIVNYKKSDRDSLEDMIENIVEIGDIE